MATLFISDLHLSAERPSLIALFEQFLSQRARQAETLYILGDLFEFWIGDDAIPPGLEGVMSGLRTLTQGGVPVYVMHGNRDFTLGQGFEQMTGCRIIDDPTVIDLYGTTTLLMHGDTLCTDDIEYQQYRRQIRDPQRLRQLLALPISERLALAQQLRQASYEKSRLKSEVIMDVNQDAVALAMQAHHTPQLIHGHTHRPAIHEFELAGRPVKRIVLGDWYEQGSVLECDKSKCRLLTLPENLRSGGFYTAI